MCCFAARTIASVCIAAALTAQESKDPPQTPATIVAAAGERWLASEQTSRDLLDDTVRALAAHRDAGLAWLGAQVPAAVAAPKEARSKGVASLVTHVTLEFLRVEHESEWRFPGQYSPLGVLQPIVGEQLFTLLLETPEWYPHTHRVQLVPALRDLVPKRPSPARFAAVVAIAENAALEPIELRRALAGLLWQWGDKRCGQQWLDELQRECVDGDAEDRVSAMLALAEFQYVLRDHAAAARTHRALASMTRAAGVALKPVDWYASACAHALSGDAERGFEALARCLELLAQQNLDSSHRLSRKLFEIDPEIATLRRDPRFPALLERAFGAGGTTNGRPGR